MFLGTFEHALDAKGRVILPAKFREQLEAGAYLAKGPDGCLALYATEVFERLVEEMVAKTGDAERNVVRTFAAGATEAAPDRQGRITIPPALRSFAGLEREVVVNGAITKIEIWDATRWRTIETGADAALSRAEPGLAGIGF
jgi:MraZ protein